MKDIKSSKKKQPSKPVRKEKDKFIYLGKRSRSKDAKGFLGVCEKRGVPEAAIREALRYVAQGVEDFCVYVDGWEIRGSSKL